MGTLDFYRSYHEWIRYVFDQTVPPTGFFYPNLGDPSSDCCCPKSFELVHLITETCLRSGTDLRFYSNAQVAAGLDEIFNGSYRCEVWSLKDESIPIEDRLRAIRSISVLYRDCLAQRCLEVSPSSWDEMTSHQLDVFLFNLWDVCPLSTWRDEKEKDVFCKEIARTLEDCLYINHEACIVSALRGLSEMHQYVPSQVEHAIDLFLKDKRSLSETILHYANESRNGWVF